MVVAIDGPAGVGKSTIAKMIAKSANLYFLNSGNFYRAVTWSALEKNLKIEEEKEIINLTSNLDISIINERVNVDGIDIEDYLHSDSVDKWVAKYSSIVEVRKIINKNIRQIAESMSIIIEGRDMTTVVFPDADLKIFLDASIKTRAERRLKQGVSSLSYDEIYKSIEERDEIDRNKPEGSLKIADEAIYLDSSDLTIDEVCEKVIQKIRELK